MDVAQSPIGEQVRIGEDVDPAVLDLGDDDAAVGGGDDRLQAGAGHRLQAAGGGEMQRRGGIGRHRLERSPGDAGPRDVENLLRGEQALRIEAGDEAERLHPARMARIAHRFPFRHDEERRLAPVGAQQRTEIVGAAVRCGDEQSLVVVHVRQRPHDVRIACRRFGKPDDAAEAGRRIRQSVAAPVAARAQIGSVGAEQQHRDEGEDADRRNDTDGDRVERPGGAPLRPDCDFAHALHAPGRTKSA